MQYFDSVTQKPTRVLLFHTCIVNSIYPEVGMSVVRVLEKLGLEVVVPESQTCCGQPAYNAGYHKDAAHVARSTIDLLSASEGPILIPSGSCGDMIIHQYHLLLEKDSAYLKKVQALTPRCFEFSQFLVDVLGITDLKATLEKKVAYHPSCHLMRGLGAQTQAKSLLGGIHLLQCVEFTESEECCGFGGMFSVKNAAISGAMMDKKINHLVASGTKTVVSCDMGCLMHLHGGLHRKKIDIEVKHLAQIIEEGLC